MDYGTPKRVVAEAASEQPAAVYAAGCKLLALFCASVGQTGLPTDPPPTTPPPVTPAVPAVTAVTPDAGVDGGEVIVTGTGFGVQGPNSKVTIGASTNAEEQMVVTWGDTEIVLAAVQGNLGADMPWPLFVHTDDGQVSGGSPAPAFTFTAAAREADDGRNGKRGHKKGRHAKADERATAGTQVAIPADTVMLTNHDGSKILVGPFALEAGRMYPLPLLCGDGLAIVVGGPCDVTLLLNP